MSQCSISFAYGEQKDGFQVTVDEAVLSGLIQAKAVPSLADFPAQVRQALDHPIGSLPLKDLVQPGEKILIITSDITRPVKSEEFMPVLVEYLNEAGIRDEDMHILVATGTHREATEEDILRLLGPDLARRIPVTSNRAAAPGDFVYLGTSARGTPVKINRLAVEADRVILTGGISFHFLAGYSGGRKSIVPGIAAQETIQANHSLVLDAGEQVGQGLVEGNPLAEDMEEATAMLNPSFLLNVVLNHRGEPAGVFAGHWIQAHRAGCAFAHRCFGVTLPEKRPLVIAGAGGFPKDINLYQAAKGLLNAMAAVEEGGTVVFVAECREGIGSDEYFALAKMDRSREEKEEILRREFSIARYIGYLNSRWARQATIRLVSALPADQVRAMGMEPCRSLAEALTGMDPVAFRHCWFMPQAAGIAVV
ncbi:MAG TPA: nickel-dependent lactate racemase [Clostridia bacterium]|nr:nickel-dependent lactate racemase [Clostridia bacterium]